MGFLLIGTLVSQGLEAATCPLHNHGNLAVIIDDLGYNLDTAHAAAAIPAPLTMSIIPGTPYAMEVADLGAKRGKEVMLHMPMAAVRTRVSDPLVLDGQLPVADISQRVQQALQSVPGAAGMNNHMGSALTTNREAMDALMSELAAQDMFFIDSRTTAETVARDAAKARGVPSASRTVFLDNKPELAAVEIQIKEAVRRALVEGYAIAIGHPHPATLTALSRALPRLPADVTIVSASQIARCHENHRRTSMPRAAR
ncbi:MAG: divergent polysaccharide deacetylase family protein [Luminiphilus sp.]|nr:divergent polysaccharide deacetylase family protein [Luminiphilus sp.]